MQVVGRQSLGEPRKYGLLLPHFGSFATRDSVVLGARLAEDLGYDSVWVRDHLVYHPHPFDDTDITNIDAFVGLSAAAAVTSRVALGTATLIPHRHPILAALMIQSLAIVSGQRPLIMAWGTGNDNREFEAIGIHEEKRGQLLRENLAAVQALLRGGPVGAHGARYDFDDVSIRDAGESAFTTPSTWIGGSSIASLRLALDLAEGWLPGRMPLSVLRDRATMLKEMSSERNRPIPSVGAVPWVSIDVSSAEARRHINMDVVAASIASRYPGIDGATRVAQLLDGAVLIGDPERIVGDVLRLHEAGAAHIIFDLRPRFADWEACVRLIGSRVLPALRGGAA